MESLLADSAPPLRVALGAWRGARLVHLLNFQRSDFLPPKSDEVRGGGERGDKERELN